MYPAMENAFSIAVVFEKQSSKYKEKTCTSCSFSCEYNDIYPTFGYLPE